MNALKKALPAPPTDIWASLARNGRRYHALTRYEPYEYDSACGTGGVNIEGPTYVHDEFVVAVTADVPYPPKPCLACVKALNEENT